MKQGDCYYCFYGGTPEDSPICVECGIARKNYTPRKGGCGRCPYTEETCYELRKYGSCFYDGVFTEIEYENCKFRLAPTNYDRIKKMSVEELAEFESKRMGCPPGKPGCNENNLECNNCHDCWLDWLKQEVE